jgi:hypothetical protein
MNWGWDVPYHGWFTDFAASSLSSYQYDKKMIKNIYPN